MSEINTSKLEYTGATTPANTTKVAEAAFAGTHAGAAARAPAVVLVDANLQDAVGTAATGVDQPAAGAGLLGWLSGIYKRAGDIATALGQSLNIRELSSATDSVTVTGQLQVSNLPAIQVVDGTVSVDNFPATQQVSGTVTANLGTLNGAATAAKQDTGNTSLASIDTKTPALVGGAVPVAGPLTDTQLRAAAVPVSGPLTNTELRAAPVGFNLTQLSGVALDATGIPSTDHQDFENAGRVFNAPINPVPLTGVAITAAAQTVYANTAPNILITAGAKPVVLKEIILRVTGAGTGLTSLLIMGIMDSVARYTSGGTLLTARNNAFAASTASVRVGTVAIVAAAPSATVRTVFNPVVIKAAIPAVNEMYKLTFGEPAAHAVAATYYSPSLPPVRIPAGGSLALHLIGPGMTAAPTFEGTIVFQE